MFTVGTPSDPDGDSFWVSKWGLKDGNDLPPAWVSFINSTSISTEGVLFSFKPSMANVNETLQFRFKLQDSHPKDPKSAQFTFKVTVKDVESS